ncbi:hypothetical protein LCGC14_0220220 [marine sediment metagenome]|uniref:Uncharacterized protein n=1 Tax=marine sediment metagenome TaxID=412755 RepID=A0A0F9UUI0_9ZZZZ
MAWRYTAGLPLTSALRLRDTTTRIAFAHKQMRRAISRQRATNDDTSLQAVAPSVAS